MTTFIFIAGRPSLDFANTRAGHEERLAGPADLGRWIVEAGFSHRVASVTVDDLTAALELRETFRRALLAADGEAVATAAAAWLDGTLGRLAVDRGTMRWRFIPDGVSPCCMLVPVALDALSLAREALGRVRECAAERCDLLYLDTSRNRSRRWCSMERCGARAKATAYYRRHREGYVEG